MCPYYSTIRKVCKIYNSVHLPGDYHTDSYCLERRCCYIDCENFKKCQRDHGGIAPPPERYQ